jgi:hypothetical protein
MVRTKETNAADPEEQKATQGTAGEGMSLIGTAAEREFRQDLHEVLSTMLENVLLGNVNYTRTWADLSEEAGQVGASEKGVPCISLADAWLAEPEWGGSRARAGRRRRLGVANQRAEFERPARKPSKPKKNGR